MKKNYYLFFAVIAFGCHRQSESDQYVSQDTTAITVETPSIDTTVVDTFFADTTAVTVETPSTDLFGTHRESFEEFMARLSPIEQLRYLEILAEESQKRLSTGTGYKYNFRSGRSGSYEYNYDISGEDEDGNSVTGNIDIEGKYGTGHIADEDGNEKDIEVEWVDYGVLEGKDEDGVSYEFHVDD